MKFAFSAARLRLSAAIMVVAPLTLGLAPAQAKAPTWVRILERPDFITYIDRDTAQRAGRYRNFWAYVMFSSEQRAQMRTPMTGLILSATADCQKNRLKLNEIKPLDDRSEVIMTVTKDRILGKYMTPQDDIDHGLMKYVCKAK